MESPDTKRHNFPPDKKQKVQQMLRLLCPLDDKGNYQHSKIVKKLNLTSSYVSSILNAADVCNDTHVNKIGQGAWQSMYMQLTEYVNQDFADTTGFRLVQSYCSTMQRHSQVRRLKGFCGAGKSEGMRYYARYHDNAFHVTCRTGQRPGDFLRSILSELGETKMPGSVDAMLNRVIDRLNEMPSPVVLLDDIYYLNDRALLLIKDLIDATEGRCGWLLSGEDSMEKRLKRGSENNKAGYEALKDRTGRLPLIMPPLSKADKTEYVQFCECNRPDLLPWLIDNARTYRELNNWTNVIKRNPDQFRSETDCNEIFLNKRR